MTCYGSDTFPTPEELRRAKALWGGGQEVTAYEFDPRLLPVLLAGFGVIGIMLYRKGKKKRRKK
jgi:hypothetical protein